MPFDNNKNIHNTNSYRLFFFTLINLLLYVATVMQYNLGYPDPFVLEAIRISEKSG